MNVLEKSSSISHLRINKNFFRRNFIVSTENYGEGFFLEENKLLVDFKKTPLWVAWTVLNLVRKVINKKSMTNI